MTLAFVVNTPPIKVHVPSSKNQQLATYIQQTRYLAVEGGGACGFAYSAVSRWLHDLGILGKLLGGVAASAGAIFLFLVAVYRDAARIESVLFGTDWTVFRGHYKLGNLWRTIWRGGGVFGAGGCREFFARHLRAAGFSQPEHVTMTDFVLKTRFDLRIMVTDEQTMQAVEINANSHPTFKILDALCATMAIPGFWDMVLQRYSDGGSVYNHPVDRLSQYPDEQILGLRVDSTAEIIDDPDPMPEAAHKDTGSVKEPLWKRTIIGRLIKHGMLARKVANRSHVDRWDRVIRIDTRDVGVADFGLNAADRRKLVEWGFEAIVAWERKVEAKLSPVFDSTGLHGSDGRV